jgi:dihydroxyacetone kinase
LSKEQYAALHPEKADKIKFVVVGEDVAVGRTQGSIVGRRYGLYHITSLSTHPSTEVWLGQFSYTRSQEPLLIVVAVSMKSTPSLNGSPLTSLPSELVSTIVTYVCPLRDSLSHPQVLTVILQVPGTASTASHLSSSEIEIGMGIHNESGNRRLSPVPPLNELIPQLLDLLTSTTDPERSFLPFKGSNDEVVLLVNNLGGISELELGGIVAETRRALGARGIKVLRLLSGTFMASSFLIFAYYIIPIWGRPLAIFRQALTCQAFL